MRKLLSLLVLGLGLTVSGQTRSDTLLVAVAANFAGTMEELAVEFNRQSGHTLRLTSASSGVQYAQILNGAPFDLFFSADTERPRLLEQQGKIVAGTRFTYAIGQLVLWSADPERVDAQGEVLRRGDFRRIAVADFATAPYGFAARQVLEKLGLLDVMQDKLVTGTNISQAWQFVATGAVPLGFVAYSQLQDPQNRRDGSAWLVPAELYDPIAQQAVLLKDSAVARQFLDFYHSAEARRIVEAYGYLLP